MAISAFMYEKKAIHRCLLFRIAGDFLHTKDQYSHSDNPCTGNHALSFDRWDAIREKDHRVNHGGLFLHFLTPALLINLEGVPIYATFNFIMKREQYPLATSFSATSTVDVVATCCREL